MQDGYPQKDGENHTRTLQVSFIYLSDHSRDDDGDNEGLEGISQNTDLEWLP